MSREALWFLGTLVRPKLMRDDTGGRFALWEVEFPRGAEPPYHSHPEDETLYVLAGTVSVCLDGRIDRVGPGDAVSAASGTPHSFRVESDTARMLFFSTPAGIDDFVLALAEPARWPWLQPPPDGPRVDAETMRRVEKEHGVIRHGAPEAWSR
jgi:quercetin dioxygenase-like cupin family protein